MKNTMHVGDNAPQIAAKDVWDRSVRVPSQREWKYLSFHRFADCPFCNLRTNDLIKNHVLLEKHGIGIVSIWPSKKEYLLHPSSNALPPFPMLSDEGKVLYKKYGVVETSYMGALKLFLHPITMLNALKKKHRNIRVDADPRLLPASFLIDSEGKVKLAHYGSHYADHPTIDFIIDTKTKKI